MRPNGPITERVPRYGPHAGHTITVVGTDMPSVREYGDDVRVVGNADTWVECSCGDAWKYVPAEKDEEAKDKW